MMVATPLKLRDLECLRKRHFRRHCRLITSQAPPAPRHDAPPADGGALLFGEEVAVESGGFDGGEVACPALVEGFASTMTVRVDVAVIPALSVAT